MKGAKMKVTLEKLGITASYSRPRVSNDNPTRRSAVPHLQVSPRLAEQGLRHQGLRADLGEILRRLV
jgi:hypothetical protein